MAGRTPNPGGGRGDGPQDPDDRPSDPAPRAWLHPSELGARFDTPAAGTPAVPPPPPAAEPPSGRGVRVFALAAAGLLLLVTGFAVGSRIADRRPIPVADRAPATGAFAATFAGAGPAAPVADATRTATVTSSVGRSGAICVQGGVIAALAALGPSAEGITVSSGGPTRPATLAAADLVSGLAYLTGIECANGPMAMRDTSAPNPGDRVRVLVRPAGSTGVRATAVRVVAGGGHVANARRGTALVRPAAGTSVLGAPVITEAGTLVGIVVEVGDDGAHVVPTAMARRVIAQLVAGEPARAGWLGVAVDTSATVASLGEGSPAAGSGVEVGDTVYALDGRRTPDAEALLTLLQTHAPGDRITVTLERGGRTRDLPVTLGSPPTAG